MRLRFEAIRGIVRDPPVQFFEQHVADGRFCLLRGGFAVPGPPVSVRAPLLPCRAVVEVKFLSLRRPYRAEQREGEKEPKDVATPVPERRHQSGPMEQSL